MFKRIVSLCMSLVLLTGCSQTETQSKQEMVSVTSMDQNGQEINVDVPYLPERMAVLDLAVLDIVDHFGFRKQVVGIPKSTPVEYLDDYFTDESIENLGSVQEVDLEALMSVKPDVIFIGPRLTSRYEELSKIAPVVMVSLDYEKGTMESFKENVLNLSKIFGKEEQANEDIKMYDERVEALRKQTQDKTMVLGLVTASSFNTLGNASRGSILGKDISFENLGASIDSTHGNESSFEYLIEVDPDYIFVLDKDSAVQREGSKIAQEVMDNELVKQTSAYQNNRIVYLTPSVWYLAEGGIQAMDQMLEDVENCLK